MTEELLRIGVLLERTNDFIASGEKMRALVTLQEARSLLYEIAPPHVAEVIPFPPHANSTPEIGGQRDC